MKLVRVPLRISLAGGGSDVPSHYEKHGGSVVSFTIDKYIYITCKPTSGLYSHKHRLVYSQVEECNSTSEIKHPIIKAVFEQHDITVGMDLDIMSDIPAGTGMGSSSAFTVGMHKLFSNCNKQNIAERACNTEINILKEPIGKQDQFAASYGGFNRYIFTTNATHVQPINLLPYERDILKSSMCLIYVGGKRSASHQLAKQFCKNNSSILNEMADIARVLYYDLFQHNLQILGHYLNMGWRLKKKLSPDISTERIDTIIDTACKNGATGGKLLGAGGAGFVLLFCPPEDGPRMLKALEPMNLTYVPFKFEDEGAKVLYED